MNEQIFFEQKWDSTAEGEAIETYLNRWLGIRVSGCVLQIDKGFASILTDNKPIRHILIRDNQGQPISTTFRGGRIFAPIGGWSGGGYSLTYASGYGRLLGVLPAHIDQTFTAALSENLDPPNDITLALRRLAETFEDREGGRSDIQSQSQEFGNTQWVSAVYRATIPTEIRGLLMNHRKVAI